MCPKKFFFLKTSIFNQNLTASSKIVTVLGSRLRFADNRQSKQSKMHFRHLYTYSTDFFRFMCRNRFYYFGGIRHNVSSSFEIAITCVAHRRRNLLKSKKPMKKVQKFSRNPTCTGLTFFDAFRTARGPFVSNLFQPIRSRNICSFRRL